MKWLLLLSAVLAVSAGAETPNVQPLVEAIKERACALVLANQKVLVVFGLGNHGYGDTRHNAGADWIEHVIESNALTKQALPVSRLKVDFTKAKHAKDFFKHVEAAHPSREPEGRAVMYDSGADYALFPADHKYANLILVEPQFDINASGDIVNAVAREAGLVSEQLVVVYDDIMRPRASLQTQFGRRDEVDKHNGLISINEKLGHSDYFRVRIGISNPEAEGVEQKLRDWVVDAVPEQDKAQLNAELTLDHIIEAVKKGRN